MNNAIEFKNSICKGYFDNVSFSIESGTFSIIVTENKNEGDHLCRILTAISYCNSGDINVLDWKLKEHLSYPETTKLRQEVAVVPTSGGLISNLKMWENIALPRYYHTGFVTQEQEDYAIKLLSSLGFTGEIMAQPATLSLEEKRMAAIVRSALMNPKLIIYNHTLDDMKIETSNHFFTKMKELHSEHLEMTSVLVTSSKEILNQLQNLPIFRLHNPETNTRNP